MKIYINWCLRMNQFSGNPAWWVVFCFGWLLMLGWFAAAMPYVATILGCWKGLGKIVHLPTGGLAFIIYNHWTLVDPVASHYIVGVILAIVLAKFGCLMALIGSNFGRGYHYFAPEPGHLRGYWRQPNLSWSMGGRTTNVFLPEPPSR